MFIGIYLHALEKTETEIVSVCYDFASAFDSTFGSLRCFELRPTGFSENAPPHMCENLTCKGIEDGKYPFFQTGDVKSAKNEFFVKSIPSGMLLRYNEASDKSEFKEIKNACQRISDIRLQRNYRAIL